MNRVKIKIQILQDEHSAFGPGKADLLDAIINHGSISAAAKSIGMSYKRAWDLVDEMNKGFKEDLVMRKIGGAQGGGAYVTEFGLKILSMYRKVITKSEIYVTKEMTDLLTLLKT